MKKQNTAAPKQRRSKTAGFSMVEIIVSLFLLLMLSALGETAVSAGTMQRKNAVETLRRQQQAQQQLYQNATTENAANSVTYLFTSTYQNVTLNLESYAVTTDNGTTYLRFRLPGGG